MNKMLSVILATCIITLLVISCNTIISKKLNFPKIELNLNETYTNESEETYKYTEFNISHKYIEQKFSYGTSQFQSSKLYGVESNGNITKLNQVALSAADSRDGQIMVTTCKESCFSYDYFILTFLEEFRTRDLPALVFPSDNYTIKDATYKPEMSLGEL